MDLLFKNTSIAYFNLFVYIEICDNILCVDQNISKPGMFFLMRISTGIYIVERILWDAWKNVIITKQVTSLKASWFYVSKYKYNFIVVRAGYISCIKREAR